MEIIQSGKVFSLDLAMTMYGSANGLVKNEDLTVYGEEVKLTCVQTNLCTIAFSCVF